MHRSIVSKRVARAALVVGLVACSANRASANLTIIPTFDVSITGDPNSAAIQAGINQAITRVQNYIANPVTVHITFKEMNTGLGQSSQLFNSVSLNDYKTALATQINSPNDLIAQASLPVSTAAVNGNPVASITNTLAPCRALGIAFSDPGAGQPDSTISLHTSIMNLSRTGPQNGGFTDLQAVAAHEINKVLGIGGGASQLSQNPNAFIGAGDLYRYSAPGVRSYTTSDQVAPYFSINGGVTNFVHFNQKAAGDYGDYGNGIINQIEQVGNTPPLVQDAFSTSGVAIDIGPVELAELDVVGWNLTPAGIGIIAMAALGLLTRRKRNARPACASSEV